MRGSDDDDEDHDDDDDDDDSSQTSVLRDMPILVSYCHLSVIQPKLPWPTPGLDAISVD